MKVKYIKMSVLENDHLVYGTHKIGKDYPTQWGPRKVIGHKKIRILPEDSVTLGEIATGVS